MPGNDRRIDYAKLKGEIVRFVGVGLVSYGLGIALASLFHEIGGFPQQVAVAFSLVIVFTTNFFLARVFIYRSTGRVQGQALRFLLTSATLRVFEYVLFLVLLDAIGINYLISLTVAMASSSALKFVVYKTLVFANPEAEQ